MEINPTTLRLNELDAVVCALAASEVSSNRWYHRIRQLAVEWAGIAAVDRLEASFDDFTPYYEAIEAIEALAYGAAIRP